MVDIKAAKLFLLDMDGTIYHENELIEGATEFFDLLNEKGIKYAFMTNNSSKSSIAYVNKLNSLKIPAESSQIVSSVQVTINYLKNKFSRDIRIYLIGTESFKAELQENGFCIVPADYRNDDVDLVLLGFDTELSYEKITGACHYLNQGIEYIATNCDLKCPIKGGRFIPDCGAMAHMLEIATERTPLFLGKPEPQIVYTASEMFGVSVDSIVCVGDRLYTDIAVGKNAGCKTALVLTGETSIDDLADSDCQPDYVFNSIFQLYETLR